MSRSFLTNESVPSLLFFLIFFTHMLLPLSIGIGLWLHLTRVSRARLITGRAMTLWIVGSLMVLSMLLPATSARPAQMTAKMQRFTIDWWYLWPMGLTDRLSGGALWAFFLGTGLVTLTAPWWMARRRLAPAWQADVDLARCFGCTLCAKDCPFNAISMVAREDGKKFEIQSQIDPMLCVGCGVCVGACDSQAINLPALDSRGVEKNLNAWIDATKARGEKPFIAYCCDESGAERLRVNADGTSPEMPGYRIERVPCSAWISAVMLERPLSRGVEGILVIEYVKSFSTRWRNPTNYAPALVLPPLPLWFENKTLLSSRAEKGRAVFGSACAACHGADGSGRGATAANLEDAWGQPATPTDLRQQTLRSGRSLEAIYRVLLTGIEGTPMPSFAEAMTEEQRWEVVAFIAQLRRDHTAGK